MQAAALCVPTQLMETVTYVRMAHTSTLAISSVMVVAHLVTSQMYQLGSANPAISLANNV